MMAGVVAGQARLLAPVSAALWTPLNMAVVPQIYLDAQDSVVTDVSGACSAISNLGSMGADGDFLQAASGSRPAILNAELNGKRVLSFDGTDDVMTGDTVAQKNILRNVAAGWCFLIYKKRGSDSAYRRALHIPTGGTALPRLVVWAGLADNKPTMQARRLDADATVTASSTTTSVGAYAMLLHTVNYTTRAGRIYKNGSLDVDNPTFTAAAGNTSDTASVEAIAIGARTGGVVPADIDLATVVVSREMPSDSDIDKLFGWAAHKYGLTASLPVGHPYKTLPPTV